MLREHNVTDHNWKEIFLDLLEKYFTAAEGDWLNFGASILANLRQKQNRG